MSSTGGSEYKNDTVSKLLPKFVAKTYSTLEGLALVPGQKQALSDKRERTLLLENISLTGWKAPPQDLKLDCVNGFRV